MKLLLLSICLLVGIFAFAGTTVKIKKCNGGPNGYNKLDEKHENGVHTLSCSGPGYETMHWSISPGKLPISPEEAQSEVEKKIGQKGGKGAIQYKWGRITWEGKDTACYSMTIEVK